MLGLENIMDKKVVNTMIEKEKHGETEWKCSLRIRRNDRDFDNDGIFNT